MTIFIEDKPIQIIELGKIGKIIGRNFETTVNGSPENLEIGKWKGDVVVENTDLNIFKKFLMYSRTRSLSKISSVCFLVKSEVELQKLIKKHFKVIYAAGGAVFNKKRELLFMKRHGIWDLPKGKAETGETVKETAKREVEEETSVKVKVGSKICSTWHTYITKNNNYVIKKTKWYYMECLSDKNMKPQTAEGIEKLIWADNAEILECLDNTYGSIAFVVNKIKPLMAIQGKL